MKTTPIIVANTEWTLPDILLRDIKKDRMTMGLVDMANPNVLEKEDLVSWSECVGYLMPATSRNVLRSEVNKIYLYCVRKYVEQKKYSKEQMKEIDKIGIEKIELTDNEKQKLKEYKLWLYESRGGKEQNPVINALQGILLAEKKELN